MLVFIIYTLVGKKQIKELNLLSFFRQDYFKLALKYYQSQDYNKALKYALKSVVSDSCNIDKILLLGNTYYVLQDYKKALAFYNKILLLDSHNLSAQINYVDTLINLQQYSQAKQYLANINNKEIKLFLQAKINFEQEEYASAEEGFISYTNLKDTDSWGWNMLSQSAQKNGNYQLSLDAGLKAIEVSDGDDSHQLNFAYAIYEIAVEEGRGFVENHLRKWHQKYPENVIVKQVWNSFYPKPEFCKSDTLYVKKVFDDFADSFDEILEELEYVVPLRIAEVAKANMVASLSEKISILDIGCGTGLCAQNLKKIFNNAEFLGVDVSSQMLEKARAKQIYKKLINDDIESYLLKPKKQYELIVAADVFTYFGDLKKIFQGMYRSLKNNGKIIFSISALFEVDSVWKQHLSGRFLHSQKYIENLLVEVGFSNASFELCRLRKEGREDVLGWIIFAVKT